MEKVIVDGVPLKITVDDFKRRFLDKFPKMAFEHDEEIQNAIDSMYTIFHGVGKIWKWCDKQVWFNKTRECYGLLAAWYICSMYPEYAKGIASTGGFMVKRKKIGGVDITFKDGTYSGGNKEYMNILDQLNTNPFGSIAYMMIKSSGKMSLLFL